MGVDKEDVSCRTGHFVTGIPLRLVLPLVATEIPCRPTGGPRDSPRPTTKWSPSRRTRLSSFLLSGFSDGLFQGGSTAGFDLAVAAGEALDGDGGSLEEGAGGCEGDVPVPGAEVGQGEVPRHKAADAETAYAAEGVSGEEGAVALVEEGEMAGDVARGLEDAEGAVEFAAGQEVG